MKNNYFLFFLLFFSLLLKAQNIEPESHWWITNGLVNSIVKEGNTVYLGGSFTQVMRSTPYGASIDAATAEPDLTSAKPNGVVYASAPDGLGGWYIGGSFTAVGGQIRNRLARINSDGTLHPWNPNVDSDVYALAVDGNTVYVGGYFTSIGGQARNYIAAIDATTGLATSWNPNANSSVMTIGVNGSTVYIGGFFTTVGGQARNRIAAIDITTGLAASWNPNVNNIVMTIAVDGSTIYVGGNFTSIGGQIRNRIAAIDAATGLATSWDPNADNEVRVITVNGSTIYVGGSFTTIGGQARNRIAEIDAITGLATSWSPNAGGTVHTIAISGNDVYVGGSFGTIGGQARKIAVIDATTGLVGSWNPKVNNTVLTVAVNGNKVYAGGAFTGTGVQARSNIAALDATTGMPTSWNPAANGIVLKIAISGNNVYAGGHFTAIGGQARNRIAAIDATTGLAASWNPNANNSIVTIAVSGSTVYAGGSFTTIGGQTRNRIAALDAITGLATSWNPNANDIIHTIAVDGNTVYAGGVFITIGGQARNAIAGLDAATGAATAWNPNADSVVRVIAVSGNTVYAGGDFTNIGSQARSRIAALDATTGLATSWNPNANSITRAISVSGNTIYAGGDFTNIGGQVRNRIAGIETTTGAVTPWNPIMDNIVTDIILDNGKIYSGGTFNTVNGSLRTGLAVFQGTCTLTATAGTQTDILCNGAATGEATVTATGGTGAYTYLWSPSGGTVATATGLTAGTYTVTVTDTNLCTATLSFTITQPSALATTAGTINNVSCNGGANGSATVNVTGGTGAYTYQWAPSGGTAATASGLSAGTYTVTVTDANGCEATRSFTITQPAALVASFGAQTNVSCNGGANGSATVNVTGGSPSYTYSWAPSGGTAATATGLVAGTYTVTVKDANLCQSTQSFTITQPAVLTVTSSKTDVLCNGGATGTASVSASGGTGTYTYLWSPSGGTAATASGLAVGNYSCLITDANGCSNTQNFTINQPSVLGATTSQINATCSTPGQASVTPFGGMGGYTYIWSPGGATTQSVSGLAVGNHSCIITDANGCTITKNFVITTNNTLVAGTYQTNLLCNGVNTGVAGVIPSGAPGPYTYVWSPSGGSADTATNLAAGSYSVLITSSNGCSITKNFTITQPSALVATAGTQTNVLCNGGATGAATVTATGGTGTYTYLWSPSGGTAATATGLAAGTYTVTVTDANLCTATQSFTITQPSQPLSLTPNTTQTNVLCNGQATGSATIAVTGGTGAYTYLWSNGATTNTITGLAAGIYTVTVTDANGCTLINSFTITQPTALVATTGSQTNILCNGGTTGAATVNVTGGTGAYTYLWAPSGGTAASATGLAAGIYTVTVTDANLCTATQSFTITQPSALVFTAGAQTNVLCNGNTTGAATVNVAGGTGTYTYLWSPSGGTAATATGLAAGIYTVTVTDANLCTATQSFTITQPSQPLGITPNTSHTNVSCFGGVNGTATIVVTGGTAPYSYLWSNGQTNAVATGLIAGAYTVVATDANGCTISQSFTITEPTALVASAGTQSNVSCFGVANGSATVIVTGGTTPYTYSWNTNPVQSAAMASGLAPGNYTVTVTDSKQCQTTQSFTITEPQQLMAAVNNYTNVLCFGAATGLATVSVSGGTQPYTYQWNNGQTTATANGLIAGTYNVIVTDANGCHANASVTLTQPATALHLTGSQVNVNCASDSNGSITINATGGTAPYTYAWTPAVSTANFADNLAVGNYNVVVTDANGCSDIRYFSIIAPNAVTGYFTVTNADCYTAGSATVHATGGVAPYTYLWSNGNTTPELQNIAPGTYTVTITDANGCSHVLSTTISGTAPIIITSEPQSVTINGGETVVFTVTAQNVNSYQWQVSTDGGLTFTNLNGGGSLPGYFGVATPTLTITNAYTSVDGYQYRVILLQQNGCYILSDAATLTVNPPVAGIDDIRKQEITLYPNPASTEVFIKIPDFGSYGDVKVAMHDLSGRVVRNEELITSENYRLDVSGLESAVYIITITSDAGTTNKKVTIRK